MYLHVQHRLCGFTDVPSINWNPQTFLPMVSFKFAPKFYEQIGCFCDELFLDFFSVWIKDDVGLKDGLISSRLLTPRWKTLLTLVSLTLLTLVSFPPQPPEAGELVRSEATTSKTSPSPG